MCSSAVDCAGPSSCVAGRCVAQGAVAAISTARRMLYDPVEIGYVERGAARELPSIAALGGGDGALALLRFSVALPPDAGVVEAYLLLDRVTDVDSDPEPIALHAARVLDPWDERSLSWAIQPRVEEVGSPVTRVLPASGSLVRLDVRAIVERWRRRRGDDFGLAIVSDAPSGAAPRASETVPTVPRTPSPKQREHRGMAFALAPRAASGASSPEAPPGAGGSALGPRLELYLR